MATSLNVLTTLGRLLQLFTELPEEDRMVFQQCLIRALLSRLEKAFRLLVPLYVLEIRERV